MWRADEEVAVVLCTAPSADEGASLGRQLVERRLAACVNVVDGLRSIYRWQGEVHDEPEALMVIKTRRDVLADLELWLREAHPYEVPEIVALPLVGGSGPYLQWVLEQTAR